MCTSEMNLFRMRSEASKMKSWMVANIFQLFLFLSVAQTVTCCVSVSVCPPQTRTWSSPPLQGKNMTLAPRGLWWLAQFVWRNLAEETWKSSAAATWARPWFPIYFWRQISYLLVHSVWKNLGMTMMMVTAVIKNCIWSRNEHSTHCKMFWTQIDLVRSRRRFGRARLSSERAVTYGVTS